MGKDDLDFTQEIQNALNRLVICLPPNLPQSLSASSEMKSKVGNVFFKSVILKGLVKKMKDLLGQLEKEERVGLTLDPNTTNSRLIISLISRVCLLDCVPRTCPAIVISLTATPGAGLL